MLTLSASMLSRRATNDKLRMFQSFVNDSLFEFYVFHLYFEQILLDEDQVETRLRLHRTMATVVQCLIFTENRMSNTVRFLQAAF